MTEPALPREVMTLEEGARYLRIGKWTMNRLVKAGKIPGAAKIGGQWRLRRSGLLKMFEEQNGGEP